MLTEAEKKWLKNRNLCSKCDGLFVCIYRERYPRGQANFCTLYTPAWMQEPNYKDAAEFEARVAVYMTKGPCFQCKDKPGPNARYCIGAWGREGAEACRLKHARLAVEEEMP